MELSDIFQSIIMITFMIAIGAIISRTFIFNHDTQKLFITLIVNVAMPCIILSSIFHVNMEDDIFKKILIVFLLSILINLLGILIGWILARIFFKDNKVKSELAIMSGLGNTAFIGIPLCAVLFGTEGALYAAIFDAGVDFVIWTICVLLLQKDMNFSFQMFKSMINTPIIAIVAGLTLAYFNLKPPTLFIDLTDQLSVLAAPLAMFYIGVLLMNIYRRKKFHGAKPIILLPITVKLIILPIIVALVIPIFPVDKVISQVIIVQSMMPTLHLASILFAKYSADEELGATTTVVSTIVSFSTIPLIILLVNTFF
ncbi:AEC family transporter [Oceanobacillus senegalensis]|uniref:AEC family transporter n=1 Tax=Oceanobacillus senegalensis TaxID=1936063 RepID=UPI000A3105A9|nr:AEC family transporter [Oceanobacillus senegalensis]